MLSERSGGGGKRRSFLVWSFLLTNSYRTVVSSAVTASRTMLFLRSRSWRACLILEAEMR